MSADKELIDLAIKATGRDMHGWTWMEGIGYRYEGLIYNPLVDDGDAFRLAVECRIDFYVGSGDAGESAFACYFMPKGDLRQLFMSQRFDGAESEYAATRRAIVRAAAEIGKEMG